MKSGKLETSLEIFRPSTLWVRWDVSGATIMRIKMVYDWDKKPRRLKNIRKVAMAMKTALPSTLMTAIEAYSLVA